MEQEKNITQSQKIFNEFMKRTLHMMKHEPIGESAIEKEIRENVRAIIEILSNR